MEALVPLALIFWESFGELKIALANVSSAWAGSVGALNVLSAIVVCDEIKSVAELLAGAALIILAVLLVQASVALLEVLAGLVDVVLWLAVSTRCEVVRTFWKARILNWVEKRWNELTRSNRSSSSDRIFVLAGARGRRSWADGTFELRSRPLDLRIGTARRPGGSWSAGRFRRRCCLKTDNRCPSPKIKIVISRLSTYRRYQREYRSRSQKLLLPRRNKQHLVEFG